MSGQLADHAESRVHWTEPHHDGSPQYVSTSEPDLGDTVGVRLWVPHAVGGEPGAQAVHVRFVRDGEPRFAEASCDGGNEYGAWWTARFALENPLTSYRFLVSGGPRPFGWLNGTGIHHRDVTDAADFRISTQQRLPAWVSEQVGYQIFPDRFGRTATGVPAPDWAVPAQWDDPPTLEEPLVARQFYGGTLDGVVDHLDHLDALGIGTIYLTPTFPARSNHRYDAVSFDEIDQLLGGETALARLIEAAGRRGIRILGDFTTNHTGVHHPWFERAVAEPASQEAGFYRFSSNGYASWLDVPSLPKLDHGSAELRRRLYQGPDSVIARWLAKGLAGWRIDVANMTGRLGAEDLNHSVAREIRATMAAVRPDSWLLAEHCHDASLDLRGDGWHGAMDYGGFTRPVWAWLNRGAPGGPGEPHGLTFLGVPADIPVLPATAASATMREVHAGVPWSSWMASTSHLDSHDTPRFRSVVGGGVGGGVDRAGRGRPWQLVGLALQMTMPGVPMVFMGDEIGLTGRNGEHARTPFPWGRREQWDEETFDAYVAWIALRKAHVALRAGGMRWLHTGASSMTYLREHPAETVLVHVARSDHPTVRLPLSALGVGSAGDVHPIAGRLAAAGGPGHIALPSGGPAAHAYLVERGILPVPMK